MHPHTPPVLPRFSPRTIGLASALITVLIWTSFIIIARASADPSRGGTLSPFDIVFCRIVGASLILLPWGWWLVQRDAKQGVGQSSLLGLSPLSLKVTASVGFFGGALYPLLAYSGFVFAPAGHAAVLLPGSLPLWTALLAVLILGERITLLRGLGLGLIVLGDLLVGGVSLLHAFDGGSVWRGDVLFMAGALCWSVYGVLVRRHALDAVRATIAITAFAFCTFVPVYALLLAAQIGGGHLLQAPLSELLFQATFQGWGSVVISGITFTKMIQYYGPIRTTMITALVPGLSAFGAVVFLGEPLVWNLSLGLALVTVGILFGVRAVKNSAIKKEAALAQPTSASASLP